MNDHVSLREVAVGLIVADDGRLLLQHRDDRPGVAGAGLWGFFGGHLEDGERATDAFLREIDEELGWRPRHFERYLTTEVRRDPGGAGWHVVSHVFAAHLDVHVDALTLGEGQAMGLFAPDALPQDVVPGIPGVIEEFARSDAYRRMKRAWDIMSTTALLIDARGRFLLQLRDDKPDIWNPGMWGSFGGRIEPYETPDDGFLRELEEELRWQPRHIELYGAGAYRTLDDDDRRQQLIYVYAAPVDIKVEAMVLAEGQAMSCFAPDALPEGIVPGLRRLIERFAAGEMYGEMVRRAGGASG